MSESASTWATLILAALCPLACRPEPPVLLYHAVGCETGDPLDVPLAQFREELAAARSAGFTFVPLDALLDGAAVSAKPLALTFDDGAQCLFSAAYPELLAQRVPFTLFVPSGWLTTPHVQVVNDRTSWPTLTLAEVRQMLSSGLLELGSHGVTHARLPVLADREARAEIADSRRDLSALTGAPVQVFAYPFGAFGRRELGLVKEAGYGAAVGVSVGAGGRLAFHRRSIHAGLPLETFLQQLDTRWTWPLFAHD